MISKKMIKLSEGNSVIRAMFEEGKRLSAVYGEDNVFDFSIGNPNVEPPKDIKDAIFDVISEESPNTVHGYMSNSGYEDVRKTIAEFLNGKYELKLKEENIVMTCGAAGGLNVVLKTILNPEDEVIVLSPYFVEYRNYVNNYDGKLVEVPCNTETFEPDIELLKRSITPKTKAVIINSPNNPTGVVYSSKVISEMAEVLNSKGEEFGTSIYLISDEPYREIAYDDIEVPYILNYYRNSFVVYSYSKSLSLPGERIGYISMNSDMDEFKLIVQCLSIATRVLGFVNAPSLFQRVIGKCLNSSVDVNIYKKNRDIIYNHLLSLGFSCVKPNGTFYLFPKTPIEDDVQFVNAAKKYNILIVPGSSFGCSGHFRLSYCVAQDKIEKSLDGFTKLAKEFIK